eukprot:CAMPEP_0114623146 /NCGR_PEP_ID=MMETSP0168-20121206/10096_1 /TAXON_ID=95228 ORGANISM="Vannella sp., Strain DIVA3 517/6/12" /NCGR_SAMPLE_ID=MMETSP0168 /ASSEMBLY_ACC=CAM_ASM_000044 /LENGTH=306 /DNA_ID=CAMNT_0001834371 /DNA_START=29 /DNA_END=946 /DNA_ORIENTATION=-
MPAHIVITCGDEVAQFELEPRAVSVAMLQLRAKDRFGLCCPAHEVLLTSIGNGERVETRQQLDACLRVARAAGFPFMLSAAAPEPEEEEEDIVLEEDFATAGFLRQLVQLPLMQRVGEAWGIDADDVFEVIDRFEAGAPAPRPTIRRLCATVADRLGLETDGMAEVVEEAFEGGQELLTSLQEEMTGVSVEYEEEEEEQQPLDVRFQFREACSACGARVSGELYSCSVCPAIHFCAACEASNADGSIHALRHPLIKRRHPQCPVVYYSDSSDSESESDDDYEQDGNERLAALEEQLQQMQFFIATE